MADIDGIYFDPGMVQYGSIGGLAAPSGGGGGGGDVDPPYVSDLTPADASEISKHQPIAFNFNDDTGIGLLAGWIKFDKKPETLQVYDGTEFLYPFDRYSTIEDVNADGTLLAVSVRHNSGWPRDIEGLTFRAADGNVDVI